MTPFYHRDKLGLLGYHSHVWLLYVGCVWVAGMSLDLKIGVPLLPLSLRLVDLVHREDDKTRTAIGSLGDRERSVQLSFRMPRFLAKIAVVHPPGVEQ